MSWMNITCGNCGHSEDYNAFTVSSLGIQLPPHNFQCPACGCAWRIEKRGEARITESGLVIPADRECVPTQRFL